MTLLDLYNILLKADIPVAHYETELEKYPYIVYQELTTSYQYSSGQPWREDIAVEVVHFTEKEFDSTLETLKEKLLENKINFTIAHGYDAAEKVIMNQFTFTITKELE